MKNHIEKIASKYKHIGYSYPNVPDGWLPIVIDVIIKIEKEMWPQWWIPMFIKRWIHYLATGNSVVFIKYQPFHKLRTHLNKGMMVIDIKDKYCELRIYGYFNDKIYDILDEANKKIYNICEDCACNVKDNMEKQYHGWWRRLCDKCAEKYL